MNVFIYRCDEDGSAIYYGTAKLSRVAGLLVNLFIDILGSEPNPPKLHGKSLQHLSSVLDKAVIDMNKGGLVNVQLLFRVGAGADTGVAIIGFHCEPAQSDLYVDSNLMIAINTHGHLSKLRLCPTESGAENKAAAFGMGAIRE